MSAPSNLIANTASASQINLRWTDNNSFESGFKIERRDGGSYSQIATVGPSVTTYADSRLAPSTTYFYRVRAFNDFGDSGYSNQGSATAFSPTPTLTPTPCFRPCLIFDLRRLVFPRASFNGLKSATEHTND
jgi:Fibronectin type III domain